MNCYQSKENELNDSEDVTNAELQVRNSIESDYKLLLHFARLLLFSDNMGAILSVAQLYYHLAPKCQIDVIVKPLLRGLSGSTEFKVLFLEVIVTITSRHKVIFKIFKEK